MNYEFLSCLVGGNKLYSWSHMYTSMVPSNNLANLFLLLNLSLFICIYTSFFTAEAQYFNLKFIVYYYSAVINHSSFINFIMSQRIPTEIFSFLETVLHVLILVSLFLLFYTRECAHNTMIGCER